VQYVKIGSPCSPHRHRTEDLLSMLVSLMFQASGFWTFNWIITANLLQ